MNRVRSRIRALPAGKGFSSNIERKVSRTFFLSQVRIFLFEQRLQLGDLDVRGRAAVLDGQGGGGAGGVAGDEAGGGDPQVVGQLRLPGNASPGRQQVVDLPG